MRLLRLFGLGSRSSGALQAQAPSKPAERKEVLEKVKSS